MVSISSCISGHKLSVHQYSNMAPRLSGQTSIFSVDFFASKSLLGIERQKKLEKFTIFTREPRSHVRILIYRTWPIESLEKRSQFWCRIGGKMPHYAYWS